MREREESGKSPSFDSDDEFIDIAMVENRLGQVLFSTMGRDKRKVWDMSNLGGGCGL